MLTPKKRPGSPFWQIEGTLGGRRFRRSSGTTSKRAAEALARRWEREEEERQALGDAATRTFAEAATLYLDRGGEARFLAPIVEEIGMMRLADVTQHTLDQLEARLFPNAAPATINRQLYSPVSAILNKAAVRGWCQRPAFERPRGHSRQVKPTDWRTPEEIEALVSAADPRVAAMVTLFVGIGLREADMLTELVAERLWLDHAEARITIGKTGRTEHAVPLQPRVVEALQTIKRPTTGPIIRNRHGEPYGTGEGHSLNPLWRRLCQRAGIRPMTSHAFRHTWATWHYAVHRDLLRLRDEGGWASVAIVERYAKLAPPDLRGRILAHGWTMERAS